VTASPVQTASPTASPIAGQILTCGSGGATFPSAALNTLGAENGSDPAAAALRVAIKAESVPEMPLPSSGWRRVADSGTAVLFVAPGTELVPWMQVEVEASASGWQAGAWGECRLQVAVPADVSLAVWVLDPAWPLAAGSRELHVLLVEGACGASPESRILAPVIVYRSDSVLISVTVRRLPGPQDAVGCDPVRITIQLSEPLGSRNLYDSGRFPPKLIVP
jgi:hypothetical protein